MHLHRSVVTIAVVMLVIFSSVNVTSQVPITRTEFGNPVYPAYEGWYNPVSYTHLTLPTIYSV